MAGMVGDGEKAYEYTFPTGTAASGQGAKLTVTINVEPDAETGMRSTMTRAKDMFSSMRDTATKVTLAASEIYEKVEEGKEMYEDMKGRVEAGKDLIGNLKDKPFTHMADIVDNAKTIAGIDDEEEGGAEETKGAEESKGPEEGEEAKNEEEPEKPEEGPPAVGDSAANLAKKASVKVPAKPEIN